MKTEDKAFIHKAKQGDKEALEEFTKKNLGLVHACVRRFTGRGVEPDDLFQLGAMGLVKAILRFDEDYKTEFSTYAVPVILGEIRRFLRDDGLIKVSRSVKETARIVRMAEEAGEKETGGALSVGELAQKTGFSPEEITFAMAASAPTESLYRTVHEGDAQPVRLLDCIPTEENQENRILRHIAVEEALKDCSGAEREVVRLRYFEGKTQTEIAKKMGVSQVQISRLEKRALLRMRNKIE